MLSNFLTPSHCQTVKQTFKCLREGYRRKIAFLISCPIAPEASFKLRKQKWVIRSMQIHTIWNRPHLYLSQVILMKQHGKKINKAKEVFSITHWSSHVLCWCWVEIMSVSCLKQCKSLLINYLIYLLSTLLDLESIYL